jgi:hypothetical protein
MTKTTKKNVLRDIHAPKRNLSAYLLYQKAMRDTFRERKPELTFGELSQYTAAMFAEMPYCEKVMWHKRAKRDKKRYLKELAAYNPPAGYDHKGDLTEDGAARLGIEIDMKDNKVKSKRRKDPNAPKKNLSSYLLYQNHLRQTSLAKKNPISFGDIAKHASKSFKKLSSEERSYWDQKALDDKNRYDKEMKEYKPPLGFDQKGFTVESVDSIKSNDDSQDRKTNSTEAAGKACAADIKSVEPNAKPDVGTDRVKVLPKKKKRKKKLPRDEDLPKRSAGAYVFFTNEFRPIIWKENPDLKFVDIGRILGEKWRALTPKEKEPYEAKATVDKARYQKEMQAYKKRKGEELEQTRTHETQQFQASNANLEQVQVQTQGSKEASQLQSPSSVAKGGSSEYNYEYDYNQPMQSAPPAFPSHYSGYMVNNPGYYYHNDRGAH